MAALSLSVHSAMTLALISFMYNMKALSGFLIVGFLASFSALASPCVFLRDTCHVQITWEPPECPSNTIALLQLVCPVCVNGY